MKLIAACTSVYNRATITQRGIKSLLEAALPPCYRLRVFVVEDKSPDETPQVLRDLVLTGAPIDVIAGTGDLFWGGGMRLALDHAYRHDPDYVLWFNDDVQWDADAIERMIDLAESNPDAIVAGTFRDDDQPSRAIYGGVRRPNPLRPLYFEVVQPEGLAVRVESANGNGLLVARSIYSRLGEIRYVHTKGDFDYCLRAGRQGIRTLITGRTEGSCTGNPNKERFLDQSTSYRAWWRTVGRPQHFPLKEWIAFCRDHVRPRFLWPAHVLYRILKLNLLWVRNRIR